MERCDSVMETLRNQLVSAFRVKQEGGYCVIETPFLYPDNRVVTLVVGSRSDGLFEITDDGNAHLYARVGGVSDQVLKRTANDLGKRFPGVTTEHDEIVSLATADNLLDAVVALVESSQGIAAMVERRRIGDTSTRLDRQIRRLLVNNNRNYERKAKIVVGGRTVDVDYSVLPTEAYQQLNLFAWSDRIGVRTAESMAWRIEQIQGHAPEPGFTNRVVMLRDDAGAFGGRSESWQRVAETLRDTGAEIVPITDVRRVDQILAS